MAANARLYERLVKSRIEYELLSHREAFTAQEVAQASHVQGRQLAKVVLLRARRGRYLMAIVPASSHVDLETMENVSGLRGLKLANEDDVCRLFPDCEPGAMPPFGDLYGVPAYLDECFIRQDEVAFQAGNHHEIIRVSLPDFIRLAGPFEKVACLHQTVVGAAA